MEEEKNNLIQQRIKKMIQSKKKTKDDQEQLKRIKSGVNEFDTEEEINKPSSSIRLRRPVSAFKATESSHGLLPSRDKPDIDLKAILTTVFEHGTKLQEFLRQQTLDSSQYFEWLSSNELFTLAVLSKLRVLPEEKYPVMVQREAIAKIARQLQVRSQTKKCEQVQSKIARILQDRLRKLSKYSV